MFLMFCKVLRLHVCAVLVMSLNSLTVAAKPVEFAQLKDKQHSPDNNKTKRNGEAHYHAEIYHTFIYSSLLYAPVQLWIIFAQLVKEAAKRFTPNCTAQNLAHNKVARKLIQRVPLSAFYVCLSLVKACSSTTFQTELIVGWGDGK